MDDRLDTVRPLVVPEIVALPPEIDITNADRVGDELRAAFRPGVAVVIADMTRTTFCDSAAARNLLLANDKAAERQAELRLAIPSAAVLRTLAILGLDRVLRIYPSLESALTSGRSRERAGSGPGHQRLLRMSAASRGGPYQAISESIASGHHRRDQRGCSVRRVSFPFDEKNRAPGTNDGHRWSASQDGRVPA